MSEHKPNDQGIDDEAGSAALPDGELPSGEHPVCGNCGAEIRVDDVICPNCGIELVGG